ncbi:ParB/RepB/Spo0J family partition protein [Streptomyces sp. ST2-7A]|uniref:ParB/RepB/Spo0J family partition protein n=1 Tax=Streptomyces sp. ST2-7A TaxID=2907214 RepID=UPI001F360138|nr:ParB/RepB/Spo0J family partition protein [Streptomyces sp. ST2-7A]MCE7079508.1 ParB/RepB/Spo0J family partition protein [Streptomyces sp. ST2-7A]
MRHLSELYPDLPPILVNRASMRVIDGMHRVAAASLIGHDTVLVTFFDGDEEESFLRAIADNVTRGLPLTVADRKAAALRILGSHPELSDRSVATRVGLDAKTVAAARRSTRDFPQPNSRLGTDGKLHPLDRTAERIRAAELMTAQPGLPLRTIVEQTGLSLGTAHDVRQRLRRGESPVPDSRRRNEVAPEGHPHSLQPLSPPLGPPTATDTSRPGPEVPRPGAGGRGQHVRRSVETLHRLAGDPSMRHTEAGRRMLHWLHTRAVLDDDWRLHIDAVPTHRTATIAEIALQCSRSWKRFADELTGRKFTKTSVPNETRKTSENRNHPPHLGS